MKKIPAAGGVVINELGEVLLIFRRSKWDLPKGHVESGETFEACALREVKEETGLKNLSLVKFVGITEHEYYDHQLQTDVIKETRWFEMKASKSEPMQVQYEESIEWVRWVPKHELENYLRNTYENIIDIFQQAGVIHI